MNRKINFIKGLTIAFFTLTINSTLNAQEKKDPVLMTIANSKVTLGEFENIYRKNGPKEPTILDKKSLNEYLDLFINFKLKVKEAEELGLDTSASFKEELTGYRKQLAQPYLTDKEINEKLLKEAYERMQTDIKASHILINLSEEALPKDTLEAYNKAMKIRSRILKNEDFAKVAKEPGISDDPSAPENGGDLGYFSALQMVYPFETAAYNTKVGEVSMPVRTRYGYHIIKVADKRKAQGEVLVAHIMVRTPPDMSAEDSTKAKAKIEEIHEKLKKGENFADLAMQYSDDKASAKKGGELPWFGTNRMPVEFENASFALKNKEDISEPVRTKFGWHIIKKLDHKSLPSFDEVKAELKTKISRDSRSQAGRQSLIAKIKKEYKFKENLKARNEFYKVVDTSYFEGTWTADKAKGLNKPMFSLLNTEYTQSEFAKYLESHQTKRPKTDVAMVINTLYNQYVDESAIAFEEKRLDEKYPEFKALMQEYRDGILLFELTDKKVWSKAVKDSVGLKAFYEKNKNNYMWEERAEASIYSCNDEKTAQKVRDLLKKKKSEKDILAEINKDSQLNLQIENRIFQKNENPLLDANWIPGISQNKVSDKKVEFVLVHKILNPEPKTFLEAKGLVTADYQNHLEKEWIEELRKKYPVDVNKEVFSTIQ